MLENKASTLNDTIQSSGVVNSTSSSFLVRSSLFLMVFPPGNTPSSLNLLSQPLGDILREQISISVIISWNSLVLGRPFIPGCMGLDIFSLARFPMMQRHWFNTFSTYLTESSKGSFLHSKYPPIQRFPTFSRHSPFYPLLRLHSFCPLLNKTPVFLSVSLWFLLVFALSVVQTSPSEEVAS